MNTFTADVTREGSDWLGDIPELEGASTYAPTLARLVEDLQDVAIMAADLPDDADVAIELRFDDSLADVADAASVGQARRANAQEAQELAERTNRAVHQLSSDGYSVRDIATIVGITHGRVSQIAQGTSTTSARGTKKIARSSKASPRGFKVANHGGGSSEIRVPVRRTSSVAAKTVRRQGQS